MESKEMTIQEFIHEVLGDDFVSSLLKDVDPIEYAKIKDPYPYDDIKCIDGEWKKVCYCMGSDSGGKTVEMNWYPVEDIIQVTPSKIDSYDKNFRDLWYAYMENIESDYNTHIILKDEIEAFKKYRESLHV